MGEICDKEQKGGIPLLLFATGLTYQLKQGPHYETYISVSNLTLIIMKSYKIGNISGRTRIFGRSKMEFFQKIVNSFQQLNIVAENYISDSARVLVLPMLFPLIYGFQIIILSHVLL